MSKIIRTVRVSRRVVTLGQAERDLYLKEHTKAETPRLDLAHLVSARIAALRRDLEEQAESRRQAAVAAVEAEADERLRRAREAAVAELEQVSRERYQEGYQRGLEEREGEARDAVERMAALHAALKEARGQVLRNAEVLVVDLATAVAGRILGAQVEMDRTVVARIVNSALERMSVEGALEVLVHPQDLQIARRFCQRWTERVDQDAVIKVRSSDQVERGGCMIEGPEENVDARLGRQLAAVQQALRDRVRGTVKETGSADAGGQAAGASDEGA